MFDLALISFGIFFCMTLIVHQSAVLLGMSFLFRFVFLTDFQSFPENVIQFGPLLRYYCSQVRRIQPRIFFNFADSFIVQFPC